MFKTKNLQGKKTYLSPKVKCVDAELESGIAVLTLSHVGTVEVDEWGTPDNGDNEVSFD